MIFSRRSTSSRFLRAEQAELKAIVQSTYGDIVIGK